MLHLSKHKVIAHKLMKFRVDSICIMHSSVTLQTYVRNAGKLRCMVGLPSKWTCVDMQISGHLALEEVGKPQNKVLK